MKKHLKSLSVILASVMLLACLLTGCGSRVKKPTAEDAQKYVQAILDLISTGEYDESVEFADIEEGKASEVRDQLLDGLYPDLMGDLEDLELGENFETKFRSFLDKAFAATRYTVGEAVETDDDGHVGYDVTVSIEPLKVFEGVDASMEAELNDILSDTSRLMEMSEEELYDIVIDTIFAALDRNLDNPTYAPAEEVVVHYGLQDEENNTYGISDEDGQAMSQKFFYTEKTDEE